MDCIIKQSKLSELPKQAPNVQEPNHLINWNDTRPELKKLIYLHLIRAIGEYRTRHSKITTQNLIEKLSKNMGLIVEKQIQIYIENLIFFGYISESHIDGIIILTDKLYTDLQEIDKTINQQRKEKLNYLDSQEGVK